MKLLELVRLLKPNYVADWFHKLLADLLQRCAAGDASVPNLLISSPPGSDKTELVGILFPTYIFAHRPSAHVVALANSDPLARLASGNVCGWCSIRNFKLDTRSRWIRPQKGNGRLPGMMGAPAAMRPASWAN